MRFACRARARKRMAALTLMRLGFHSLWRLGGLRVYSPIRLLLLAGILASGGGCAGGSGRRMVVDDGGGAGALMTPPATAPAARPSNSRVLRTLKISDVPYLLGELERFPGCLGTERALTTSGKLAVVACL